MNAIPSRPSPTPFRPGSHVHVQPASVPGPGLKADLLALVTIVRRSLAVAALVAYVALTCLYATS